MAGSTGIGVEGIVSSRDYEPYLLLIVGGVRFQLSMAQARNVARDIERMCARTEVDAMVHRFVQEELGSGEEAGAAMMHYFRGFRLRLDSEEVETTATKPSGDPPDGEGHVQ